MNADSLVLRSASCPRPSGRQVLSIGRKKLLKTAYLIKESQWSDIKESKGA